MGALINKGMRKSTYFLIGALLTLLLVTLVSAFYTQIGMTFGWSETIMTTLTGIIASAKLLSGS